MTYELFYESIESRIRGIFPNAQITMQSVTKNNGIILHGLIIREEHEEISPTIYLEPFYEHYLRNGNLGYVVDRIVETYEGARMQSVPEYSRIRDYEWAKDKIILRLINYEMNSQLLENVPYVPFLDLAVCFSICLDDGPDGMATCGVTNQFLNMWRVTVEDVLEVATINTISRLGSNVFPLAKVLGPFILEKKQEYHLQVDYEDMKHCSLQVLTNARNMYGAACMLYPSKIKEMAQECGKDILIIPSSIHELLVMPMEPDTDINMFNDMVAKVNEYEMEPNEILSNHIYIYRFEADRIVCA